MTEQDRQFRKEVGRRLMALRGTRTQVQFASDIGVTQASVSNYESGKRELPLSLAARIARKHAISVAYFIPDEVAS